MTAGTKNGHAVLIVAPSGAALEVSWRRPGARAHGGAPQAGPPGPAPGPREETRSDRVS
jgi:hypothetical protein